MPAQPPPKRNVHIHSDGLLTAVDFEDGSKHVVIKGEVRFGPRGEATRAVLDIAAPRVDITAEVAEERNVCPYCGIPQDLTEESGTPKVKEQRWWLKETLRSLLRAAEKHGLEGPEVERARAVLHMAKWCMAKVIDACSRTLP